MQFLIDLFGFKTFNDRLALALLLGLPGLWVANKWLPIPPEALGATIAVWTLVAQFYFRQRAPEATPSTLPKPGIPPSPGD